MQTALQIFGYIGVTTIALNIVNSYWRKKRDFQKIKKALILELQENIYAAKSCLSAAFTHTASTPILIDDAWRAALSSDQIDKFGFADPWSALFQLSLLYSHLRFVNQIVALRNNFSFSYARTLRNYNDLVKNLDDGLKERLEKLIPAMNIARVNLTQKNIKWSFAKNPIYEEIVEVMHKTAL